MWKQAAMTFVSQWALIRIVTSTACMHYTGVLACLDGYMNIALEQTEEYVNGQLKNKYGDAFIRGNNGNSAICLASFPGHSGRQCLRCATFSNLPVPSYTYMRGGWINLTCLAMLSRNFVATCSSFSFVHPKHLIAIELSGEYTKYQGILAHVQTGPLSFGGAWERGYCLLRVHNRRRVSNS